LRVSLNQKPSFERSSLFIEVLQWGCCDVVAIPVRPIFLFPDGKGTLFNSNQSLNLKPRPSPNYMNPYIIHIPQLQ